MKTIIEKLIELCISAASTLILASIVFGAGRIIVKKLLKHSGKSRTVEEMDPTVSSFFMNFMKISLNEYAMGEKLYARWTQEEIEQQMKLQYQRTRQMIQDHRDVLDALTDRLVQQKSMDQLQLEEFFTSMKV